MNIDDDSDITSTMESSMYDTEMTETSNGVSSEGIGAVDSELGNGEQDSAAATKRRAIQEIMRDTSLSELDRRHRIQSLMDGTSQISSLRCKSTNGRVGVFVSSALPEETISCVHYERKCNIVSPCCQKLFGCRLCHDELNQAPCGPMDRFSVTEIVCKECNTRQGVSNRCVKCDITFGEYFCSICKLWMADSKRPFHCPDCGFCRVGGKENFRHCVQCCMCISVNVYNDHNCMKDKYKNNCPVCREDMFSSRQSPLDLPCGHAIHALCFRKLAGFDYRCPICKKTVVSKQSMTVAWLNRARDIDMQPMPPDLARRVNIMCNDCETKSENRNWHFLGVQCPACSSFNTVVEEVVSSGSSIPSGC